MVNFAHSRELHVDAISSGQVNKAILHRGDAISIADTASGISATECCANLVSFTGGGADTVTLPTGALMANEWHNDTPKVGDWWDCHVENASGGTITWAAGASGSSINSVGNGAESLLQVTGTTAVLRFIFDDVTAGSETYHCIVMATSVA